MIFIGLLIYIIMLIESKDTEENGDSLQEQVVVRAVFINCEPNQEEQNFYENEASRFQREELFKHGALQSCHKKLALTVKITSEPDKKSGDEYIPIEHVFDGSNKKRARLLDPYILRLRRNIPLQAYKLRRIDTVLGILTKTEDRRYNKSKKSRVQRHLNEKFYKQSPIHEDNKNDMSELQYVPIADNVENNQDNNNCASSVEAKPNITILKASLKGDISPVNEIPASVSGKSMLNIYSQPQNEKYLKENTQVLWDACTLANNPAWKRDKRHEHNIIVEDITDDYKMPWIVKDRFYRKLDYPIKSHADNTRLLTANGERNARKDEDRMLMKRTGVTLQQPHSSHLRTFERAISKEKQIKPAIVKSKDATTFLDQFYSQEEDTTRKSIDIKNKITFVQNNNYEAAEKSFDLYDIGSPDLWYTVQVQLFEKISTPEGKTVWNDITKGEIASVSTFQPEWLDQDIYVRYKPTEWISKDEFALPSATNLCLLAPTRDEAIGSNADVGLNNFGKYIVVPKEDIVGLEDEKNGYNKRDGNINESSFDFNTRDEQSRHRRVLVRVSRALLTDNEEDLKISALGADRFLTLPHRRQHHAQIDLEARADENQLIRVGVKARDCGPEMANVLSEKAEGIIAGPILVPPRHTQRFRLELPTELPVDAVHCSVTLVNDDEESVAVRDVAVKKGDRCYCVWHCDCVCLNEDPKLLCREMPEARQAAAGLSPRERPRRARSVCYRDCVTINLFVIIMGVLLALLFLGLIKASFGMFCRCLGKIGLDRLVQTPRKLDHYFEPTLRGRCVVYDDEGWPVHPDTKRRNVRQFSRSMEFLLNLTIFITLPCVLLRDAIVQLICTSKSCQENKTSMGREDKKCFSTHDMQGRHPRWRRRRGGLRRWMSPQAEELSTDLWSDEIATEKTVEFEFMRPLLHERRRREDPPSSCMDSELDDTEYVLTQMQKSKESLARSQKKNNESGTSSTRKHINPEANVSQNINRKEH